MNFGSDNQAGVAPAILQTLAQASSGIQSAYGNDDWSARAQQMLCDTFGTELQAFFVTTGTAANCLALSEATDGAGAVADVVPDSELLITGESGPDPRSYRVDFSRMRSALGFEATWTIPDGAVELYQRYTAYHLTADDFFGKFTRLAVLKQRQEAGELDATMRRTDAIAAP